MFYYFFQARTTGGAPVPLPSAPLVLWLNGGPGCSSLVGLFLENGPYRVTPKLTLVPANHSWTSVAHMLYVDSPLPTGLSYATRNDDSGRPDTVRTMQDVGVTLLQFMKLFLASRPQLLQAPLYLTGESFAGQVGRRLGSLLASRAAGSRLQAGRQLGWQDLSGAARLTANCPPSCCSICPCLLPWCRTTQTLPAGSSKVCL
jgi:carboxypeptidase C (cathepsin A)